MANGDTLEFYAADDVASVVGCVGQSQLCNPTLPKGQQCSPFASVEDTRFNARNMWPEWERLKSLLVTLLNFDPSLVPFILGPESLTARYGFSVGIQAPIPANQWQLEIEHWFKSGLAYLQNLQVDYGTGRSDPSMRKFVRPQEDADGSRYFCQNQVSKTSFVIPRQKSMANYAPASCRKSSPPPTPISTPSACA